MACWLLRHRHAVIAAIVVKFKLVLSQFDDLVVRPQNEEHGVVLPRAASDVRHRGARRHGEVLPVRLSGSACAAARRVQSAPAGEVGHVEELAFLQGSVAVLCDREFGRYLARPGNNVAAGR